MGMDGPVDHVEVDAVQTEAAQRRLAMGRQRVGVAVGRRDLRADDHPIPGDAPQRSAQGFLAAPVVVRLGGVEVGDPQLDGAADDRVRVRLIGSRPSTRRRRTTSSPAPARTASGPTSRIV